jgi:hypothetical protein
MQSRPQNCGPDIVLFVTGQGEAFLVRDLSPLTLTQHPSNHAPQDVAIPGIQQIYIDPAAGALSYPSAPFSKFLPADGVTPFFKHSGSNPVWLVATERNGTLRNPPATFNYSGSGYANSGCWFACKVPGTDDHQVFPYVTGVQFEDCESGVVLAALKGVGRRGFGSF